MKMRGKNDDFFKWLCFALLLFAFYEAGYDYAKHVDKQQIVQLNK